MAKGIKTEDIEYEVDKDGLPVITTEAGDLIKGIPLSAFVVEGLKQKKCDLARISYLIALKKSKRAEVAEWLTKVDDSLADLENQHAMVKSGKIEKLKLEQEEAKLMKRIAEIQAKKEAM